MCKRAEANPDRNFVLIIDEINRGQSFSHFRRAALRAGVSRRTGAVAVPGSDWRTIADHLTIPKNLYLIGTMNSTDRSLAMIDYALRRRFYFWKLMPVVDGQAPVLARVAAVAGDMMKPASPTW